MKSKGFKNPGSHKIEKLDCINLICSVKGVIPVGETYFPLEIEGVQTDVLEGATRLLGNLRIGDVVENTRTQATGTLGICLSSPYLNHNAIDPGELRGAIAFCGYSGNQKRNLQTLQKNVLINKPAHFQSGDITMFNQLCLSNLYGTCGMKFQAGDSGTCVYVDTPSYLNKKTGCIGMLIGKSTCGHFILTPMKEILKIFEL
ncbi:unnamed protein product [Mytilus edulis]|uniref:Uncharacterized protein n=1 Tax=Mytilus edulis TaxID=6550 RepID=A0A8S3RMJ3_MYTED|nr:unnamed protein product [Mytilus edulis]